MTNTARTFFLMVGDIIALYAALFLALLLRYGGEFYRQFVDIHFAPFTLIFILWIAIFYISGLYDLRRLSNSIDFIKVLWLGILVNAAISIFLFYLVPTLGIAPKTNLFLFILVFALIEMYWRRLWNARAASLEAPNKLILVGMNDTANEIAKFLELHPQLGYAVLRHVSEQDAELGLLATARTLGANLVVIPRHLKNHPKLTRELYALLNSGVEIRDLPNFYEIILRKVPLADLEESWFLEHLANQERFYGNFKRAAELIFALTLGIVLFPLFIIIALLIAITSPGGILYHQLRVGKNDGPFMLHKFRTMRLNAEENGAVWSSEHDPRVTALGRLLRRTHLDELPQLINILGGELSFVGPRPERPEFVKLLEEKIPYYEVRLLVNPGLTGWAQVSYRYGSSVEDAYEKLQYDIYYIKNRSVIFDLAIVLKTIRSFFINA